eukprot:gene12710-14014_t
MLLNSRKDNLIDYINDADIGLGNIIKYNLPNGKTVAFKQYEPMKIYNHATVKWNWTSCDEDNKGFNGSGDFTVITNFIYLWHMDYRNKIYIGHGLPLNDTWIQARINEVLNVLAINLNHPQIQQIHILVREREAIDYLRRLPLRNSHKMFIRLTNDTIDMRTQIKYAGHCLKGRVVAICHQDNQFGQGWDKFQPAIMQNNKVMYALTRRTLAKGLHFSESCEGKNPAANCDPGYPYLGSHDVFVFHVKNEFTPELLKPLDEVTPELYGMENVVIWTFDKKFKFRVLNPCRILYVHHHHCISIRNKDKKRVNKAENTGYAGFTDQLI